uniref:E3 ubiquitin-protein ligase listerin n=1 Tax=Parascaris univalens TaxID=6257 RepID=A0A915BSS7_PARUN
SLVCLTTLCERLDSTSEKERIMKIMLNKHLFKHLINLSPQVMNGMFSLGLHLITLEWANEVLQSGLPISALTNLDNSNGLVCRSAADYFIACADGNHLFNVLNINKAVIPKLMSIIRRKESHWMNLDTRLMVIVRSIYSNISPAEKQPFLHRLLDAFFDGTSFDPSFNVNSWAVALVEFVEMIFVEVDETEATLDEDFVEYVFSKILVATELMMKREEKIAIRTISALALCVLSKEASLPKEKVDRFINELSMNLFNRLPISEIIIEQLFTSPYRQRLIDFAEMIVKSESSSAEIVADLIESSNDRFILDLNARIPLAKIIAAKVNWKTNETLIIKALLDVIDVTKGSLNDFVKLDDEICCIRLMETISKSNSWDILPRLLSAEDWDSIVEKAAIYSIRSMEFEKFQLVAENIARLPNGDRIVTSLIESNEMKVPELFLHIINAYGKTAINEEYREKIAVAALNCLFYSSSTISEDSIGKTLEAVRSIGIDDNFVVDFIDVKLDSNNLSEYGVKVALSLACSLPSSCARGLLFTAERLSTELSVLNEYDVEILEENAFLSVSSSLELSSPAMKRKQPLKQMRRAIFILDYVEHNELHLDDADSELAYSLLFATAISSLINFESRIEGRFISKEAQTLEENVKKAIMFNENGRRLLLRSFVLFASNHSIALCLLLAIRELSDGLDLSNFENDIKLRIDDQVVSGRMFAAASAIALKAISDCVEWDVSSIRDWICRCELNYSLADPNLSTVLLACFVCEGRSFFEGSLFIFQENEHSSDMNILNCALLRVLQCSCASLDVMDSALRDFLLCALLTALENCRAVSLRDEYMHSFALFASLAIRLFIECARIGISTKENAAFSIFRQEWLEFFCNEAESVLLDWFLSLSEQSASHHPALLRALSSAMHYCQENTICDAKLPPRFDVELDCRNYPERLQSIVVPLISLISHPLVDVQFAALRILRVVTVEMMRLENKMEETEEDSDESLTLAEKKMLPVVLTRIMSSSSEVKTDVPPLLLAWDAFVETLARFELAERVAYCNNVNVLLDDIMPRIFELLPQNPKVEDIPLDYSLFLMKNTELDLPIISCYVFGLFYRTLITLPALVRQWYTSLPRAAANLINSYTVKYVGPLIWKKERHLISLQKMPPHLEVRVLGAVREIIAEYDMEDAKMVLVIELPTDYPLSVPSIENEKAIVNKDVRRKWLLQLTLFLTHQNGSIIDGILMWAKNIARHLDGAEDCIICMMTVNSKTLELPRFRCKQCKNRFHIDCLRKWFETSKQSTCPLCRGNFKTNQP